MKYLIDTCVVSELVKPHPNKMLLNWMNITPSDRLFLSVITIGEIRKGLTKIPNSKRKDSLTEWLNTLIEDYQDRILPIDLTVAENWGEMLGLAEKMGMPMSSMDSLIAAVARANNLVLVTRNESDFKASNIPIINPWKDEK
ncbi:MAG: type II toxin-antitoxin system VapC family toxin [Candidatus Ozemobacteraceae bacterium]